MNETVRRRPGHTKQFLERLRDLLGALPSETEKREAEAQFSSLIAFLTELKQNLHELPDQESTVGMREVVQQLEDLFSRAEADPNLAAVLGLRRATRKKPAHVPSTPQEVAAAESTIAQLQALPVDDVRSRLQSENVYPLTALRAVAAGLRIRSAAKLSRESLVHQIAMKVANLRGYDHLRHRGEESAGGAETDESSEASQSEVGLPPQRPAP
jgi:glycine/D-amino acid oxidase-like deaminating enzyme